MATNKPCPDVTEVSAALRSHLLCAFCNESLSAPVVATCGHAFCSSCVNSVLRQCGEPLCPTCKVTFDTVFLAPALRDVVTVLFAQEHAQEICDGRQRKIDYTASLSAELFHESNNSVDIEHGVHMRTRPTYPITYARMLFAVVVTMAMAAFVMSIFGVIAYDKLQDRPGANTTQ